MVVSGWSLGSVDIRLRWAIIAPPLFASLPAFAPSFPFSAPVIPAKEGIQRVGDADAGKAPAKPRSRGAPSPFTGLNLAVWERGRPARRAALARGAPSP